MRPIVIAAAATALLTPAAARSEAPGIDAALFKGRCRSVSGVSTVASPQSPGSDGAVRVMIVSEKPRPGARLFVKAPDGPRPLATVARGGPPYWWFAQIDKPARGRYRFVLADAAGKAVGCGLSWVRRRAPKTRNAEFWPIRRSWGRNSENLYSAWIEKLFDAAAGERVGWTPMHLVLHDPSRNFFYNHFGASEDGPKARKAVQVKPDCADAPWFLRAYFAWKMRLPFAYRHCNRGSSKRPTKCTELRTGLDDFIDPVKHAKETMAARFSRFVRRRVSYVHSGSGRTAPDDNETDLYPLALTRASLRPGAVYIDPFGHLLVVSRWYPQQGEKSGLLYAIDGHPDLSIGRKRFWRGAFLFSVNLTGGAGGFKGFRPLVRRDGNVVALTNDEIKRSRNYGNFSDGQYKLGLDGFYDRMDELINPRPLTPLKAYRERLKALFELIQERIDSVKAGEAYMAKNAYKTVEMPGGPRIFETSGPWEDFSTPARDMRLLIAIHDVVNYPQKVIANPKRFVLPKGQTATAARAAMDRLKVKFTGENKVTYLRSDGQPQVLTMAQVLARTTQLEIAYNPNDCAEIRWGGGAEEMKSCKRHAPPAQLALMKRFRVWFATRTRPPLR